MKTAVAVAAPPLPAVERLWPGSTVVCLASGPSLTQADVNFCRGRARVIAIKDNIRLAPWADVLYGCDAKYWRYYGRPEAPPHVTATALEHWRAVAAEIHRPRPKYALEGGAAEYATVLQNTGMTGLETQPTGLRTGKNSGFQCINLAVHLGAARIVLLGYDMAAVGEHDHWFGDHPWRLRPPYRDFLPLFDTLVAPLEALHIQVVNATRSTVLPTFPRVSLQEALA